MNKKNDIKINNLEAIIYFIYLLGVAYVYSTIYLFVYHYLGFIGLFNVIYIILIISRINKRGED